MRSKVGRGTVRRGIERTQVEVYARAARVKLLLNGREIGSARVGRDARVTFTAVYRPGSLTAVAYDADGVEIARTSLATAGKETRLHAVPEAERIALGDGLAYVRFMYADAAGTVKPLLQGDVHIEVENGEILGFGSACLHTTSVAIAAIPPTPTTAGDGHHQALRGKNPSA